MSQLALYKFPPVEKSDGKTIIKYLSENEKLRLYTFKMCCDAIDWYFPKEMWKLIVYHMCGIKRMLVAPLNTFNFIDKFISDPRQNEFNPIIINDITKITDYRSRTNSHNRYRSFINDIDITYEQWTTCRRVPGDNMFHLREPSFDLNNNIYLLIGIIQDPNINNILINIEDQTFNLSTKDLHQFTLDNIYSHTTDDLVEVRNNDLDVYDKKYKQKESISCWSGIFSRSCKQIKRFAIIGSYERSG